MSENKITKTKMSKEKNIQDISQEEFYYKRVCKRECVCA